MPSIRACALLAVTVALQAWLLTSSIPVELAAESVTPASIAARYGSLPIAFERNEGQTDPRVQFLAHGRGYTLFLTGPDAMVKVGTERGAAAVQMTLVGAARHASATAIDQLPGVTNYFMDADPAKWRRNVRSYARVRYNQIYPGIDLVYYGNQSQLEYDFVVAPRANPSSIVLALDGADRLELDPRGHLLAHVAGGRIELKKPVAYQDVQGVRNDVPIRYAIRGNRVHLRIAAYDESLPLVVDPVLSYSTHLGGSGNDFPKGIAADSQGSAHLTGITMSPDFPATTGTLTNGSAMFVTKMNAAGTAVVYSDLFPALGTAIAVDAAGNAYATGTTGLHNFPTTPGAYRATGTADNEGIALKLDPAGAVVYSTYLPFHDSQRTGCIAVDASGNAIVGGDYFGFTGPGEFAGNGGFVTKLNATGTAIVYSKNVAPETPSGPGQQQRHVTGVFSVAVAADGSAFVTGATNSPALVTTAGAYQTALNSTDIGIDTLMDGFVVKFNPAGTVIYATYLGTAGSDAGNGIAVDVSGNALVTGNTSSSSFPVTPGAYQTTYGGGALDAFVAKLNPAGSALVYSTFLGDAATDSGRSIALDPAGAAYLAGDTGSINFPTTADAHQSTFGGSTDAFVARLSPNGSRLWYSTFFGGTGADSALGIAVDPAGGVYSTGLTPGASTDVDAFILKLTLFTGGTAGRLARNTPASDFDGDGRADVAVYRHVNDTWYLLQSSTGTAREITFGSGGVAVPGDYDGDGKTDLALYGANRTWRILYSSTNFTTSDSFLFGSFSSTAVPGDYDGDGKTDVAVFHPLSGIWTIRSSASGNVQIFKIGLGRANDVPVPADYDGDGTTDAAVYRPATGLWTIRRSSGGNTTSVSVAWGLPSDIPAPGDYDGDGLTDPAVYRPSSGEWYVLHSHSGYGTSVTRQWGLSGDTPVPGDYDGDGASDLAIYRPSTGGWYVLESGTDFTTSAFFSWGLEGDVPMAAAALTRARTVAASNTAVSPAVNLARYGDFDGDGQADITIFRPSQGAWYTRTSNLGPGPAPATYIFGDSADRLVPADYDGDGGTDFAGYRPATGTWNMLLSSTNFTQTRSLSWGVSGDIPTPADFDGDGRAEIAVYRPSTGQWFILWSHTNYTTAAVIQWGLSGDNPVPGDYDGDGRADLAVFRPASGEWFILQSYSNYATSATFGWGLNGDVPVPGDFDGDGRSDVAVYRPANSQWYILKSSTGFTTSTASGWGLNGDIPVPADYDSDGITDLAVYRPASSVWYIRSSRGLVFSYEFQWGLAGDVPVLKRE